MAYDKQKILDECLRVIEAEKLAFFYHLEPFIEPSMQTLYDWEFDKLDTIKKAISKNRVAKKQRIMKNWESEDAAPILQLAAFKLMANDDEFNRLTTAKNDVKADIKGGVSIMIEPQSGCEPIPNETDTKS